MSDKLREAHEAIDHLMRDHASCPGDCIGKLRATFDAAVKEATLAGFNSADDVVRAELVARAEAAERERDKQALSAGECLRLQQAAERERDEARSALRAHHDNGHFKSATDQKCYWCGFGERVMP